MHGNHYDTDGKTIKKKVTPINRKKLLSKIDELNNKISILGKEMEKMYNRGCDDTIKEFQDNVKAYKEIANSEWYRGYAKGYDDGLMLGIKSKQKIDITDVSKKPWWKFW